MKLPSARLTFLLGFIATAALLGLSIYLQAYNKMTPCPLCLLQRLVLIVLSMVFLSAASLNLKKIGNVFFSLLSLLIAGSGALLAGRQVWLQHLPPNQNADCGASLEYMLQAFPLKQVFQRVLTGSAECSLVDWRFLGLSLAGWSLICFSFFVLISIRQFYLGMCTRS